MPSQTATSLDHFPPPGHGSLAYDLPCVLVIVGGGWTTPSTFRRLSVCNAGRLCVCGGHRYPYAGLVGSAAFEVSVMLVFLLSSSSSVFRQACHWLSMTRLWLYTTGLAARQAGHTSRTPWILHLGMGTGQGIKSIANESIAIGFSI